MKWIGLTGGIGTGKSTVAQIFQQKGLPVVDADTLAHKVLEKPEIIEKVQSHFGENVLHSSNHSISKITIDRKALGKIVFNDVEKKQILENILHPEIKAMTAQQKKALEKLNTPLAIYNVPLIFEKNMQAEFDYVLLIASDKELVFQRIQKRGSHTQEILEKIMNSQMPQKQKLMMADFVIWNNGSIKDLEKQCDEFLEKILT